MSTLPEDPSSLISEEDRDTVTRRLQEAYAEGHISHQALDDGLHQVLTARTNGELAVTLASLPEEQAPTTSTIAPTASTIAAAAGRIRRRGVWQVPQFLKIESAMGKVNLDLSRAVIEHPVVDIELQLGTGRAKITVPRDALVDAEGLHTGWKDIRYRPRLPSRPGGPTIRITGAMGFGRLRIRHARR
ncbi:DUF1707 domain-containing protein [[Kitasatospora] papulosa]|uniref:DUF1707 SHOCT-like domain-containing protein n=1 Tax=[Kitasatospora] papulosa TaxID=1464011 RepID=UPI0038028312